MAIRMCGKSIWGFKLSDSDKNILVLKDLYAGYTKENMILKGLDLTVAENEIVAIVGQNGSGKSTLAKAIMNLLPYKKGGIIFDGKNITHKESSLIAKMGIGFFMQGGRIFPNLTVEENLAFAAGDLSRKGFKERIASFRDYFELLQNGRMNLQASYLSGGEQHQLALAMALMQRPKFLILDEPSAGLSPANVTNLFQTLKRIRDRESVCLLIIEQNVNAVLSMSNRIVLLLEGTINKEEYSNNLQSPKKIDRFFFGKIKERES